MPPLTPKADLIQEASFCNYRDDHRDSQLFKVYKISWTEREWPAPNNASAILLLHSQLAENHIRVGGMTVKSEDQNSGCNIVSPRLEGENAHMKSPQCNCLSKNGIMKTPVDMSRWTGEIHMFPLLD